MSDREADGEKATIAVAAGKDLEEWNGIAKGFKGGGHAKGGAEGGP
jgi:hypothetical protein